MSDDIFQLEMSDAAETAGGWQQGSMSGVRTDFGRSRDLYVLAWCLRNPQLYGIWTGRIRDHHFTYPPAKEIHRLFRRVYERHDEFPALTELQQLVRDEAVERGDPLVLVEQTCSAAAEVYELETTGLTGDVLAEQIVRTECRDVADTLKTVQWRDASRTLPAARDQLDGLMDLVAGPDGDLGIFPFAEETLSAAASTIDDLQGDPIATGFPRLDNMLLGGLRPGELTVIVASTGTGKSQLLCQLGLNIVNADPKNAVVYYALDNPEAEMLERLYAMASGIPIGPRERGVWQKDLQDKLSPHRRFLLKGYAPQQISPRGIRRHVRRVNQMLEPSNVRIAAILVDYGDLLQPDRANAADWLEAGNIFGDLMAVAKMENVPVISPTQGTRESSSMEVLKLTEISRAYGKAHTAAHVWSLCQTPLEKRQGKMRLACLKARRPDSQYILPLRTSYSTLRVEEDPDVPISWMADRPVHTRPQSTRSESQNMPLFDIDFGGSRG